MPQADVKSSLPNLNNAFGTRQCTVFSHPRSHSVPHIRAFYLMRTQPNTGAIVFGSALTTGPVQSGHYSLFCTRDLLLDTVLAVTCNQRKQHQRVDTKMRVASACTLPPDNCSKPISVPQAQEAPMKT
eukprot:4315133-Amphidinium_carterae.1